jgi:hypothetical protein
MKRLVASIVVLSSTPVYFLFTPLASASEVVTVCKPVTTTNIVKMLPLIPPLMKMVLPKGV